MVWRRPRRSAHYIVLTAALWALLAAMPPPALALTNFTWSGGAAVGNSSWSTGANWVGGIPPSGSVGTLSFPALTTGPCAANPPTATCYESANDLVGLSANALSIDDGATYHLTGQGITLGPGGITAAPSGTFSGPIFSGPDISFPLTLSAPQTWSIAGGTRNEQLGVATVTGPANALTVNFSGQTFLSFSGDAEVGPVTASGLGTVALGSSGSFGSLNGTDGNPVSFSGGAGLFVIGPSTVGPVTMSGGQIQVGEEGDPAAIGVNGGVVLDASSTLSMFIIHAGTTAGTDYSQVHASGNVNLGGAALSVSGRSISGTGTIAQCGVLHVGDVYTLVTTTGTRTGTFAGVPDGSTVSLECSPGTPPTVRINYTLHSVTATVLTAGSTLPPPVVGRSVQVRPVSGRVLVRRPGQRRFVRLLAGASIPIGSIVDTVHGRGGVTSAADTRGHTQTAQFYAGLFQVRQPRGSHPVTEMRLVGPVDRCSGGKTAEAARRRHRVRRLWGSARGVFSTRGRYGSAGVRRPSFASLFARPGHVSASQDQTIWFTEDRCNSTYFKVRRGMVTVRDFARRRNIILRAGHAYTARAHR
jgi:hypothetical protein